MQDLADCDIVVEAIIENVELKRKHLRASSTRL